jgi:hypothetical protein
MTDKINYEFVKQIAAKIKEEDTDITYVNYGQGYESLNFTRFRVIYYYGKPVWGIMMGERDWDLQHDKGLPKELNTSAKEAYKYIDKFVEKHEYTNGDLEYTLREDNASTLGGRSIKAVRLINLVLDSYIRNK